MLILRLHVCAAVFQKTNNHDLLSLRVYNDALDAWEVDTYDEDEDEMDSLMHHMEHELFSEFLRLVLFASPVQLACLHAHSSSTQDTTHPSDRLSKLKFSAANTIPKPNKTLWYRSRPDISNPALLRAAVLLAKE